MHTYVHTGNDLANTFPTDHQPNRQIKSENPDKAPAEINKTLGEKRKGMDETAKAPFQREADADKERCVTHMSVHRESV